MSAQFTARTVLGIVVVTSAVVAAVVWYVAGRPKLDPTPRDIIASMKDSRIDCPGHDVVRYIHADGDSTLSTALSVPGAITGVPEFHDCQRLLEGRATTYGPLVGVFARDPATIGQATIPVNLAVDTSRTATSRAVTATPPTGATAIVGAAAASAVVAGVKPAAELVDFDQSDYAPLGIKPGFNCLYLLADANSDFGIDGRMVPAGNDEKACDKEYNTAMGGLSLLVVPHAPDAELTGADIPQVARWDWDQVTRRQYIGIYCLTTAGPRWCEVGPRDGFGSSPDHHFPITSSAKAKRVWWHKGWYDEQQLAHGSGFLIRPLREVGTLVPDPQLDEYKDATFPGRTWVHAADVALTPHHTAYASKLGLDQAVMDKHMNQLHICQGSWDECIVGAPGSPAKPTGCSTMASDSWWARVTTPKGAVKYSCIIRTEHKGIALAGTARWRWLRGDETIWVRCAEGCCQVNNPGDDM